MSLPSSMPLPSSAWEEEPSFPYGGGDPYRQTDEVFRGISMAPMPAEDHPGPEFALGGLVPAEAHLSMKGYTSGGACYHEPDNFLKGICIGSDLDEELPPMPLALSGCYDGSVAFDSTKGQPFDGMGLLGHARGDSSSAPQFEKFTDTHHPPALPTDSFFKLQTTTVHVTTVAPCELGNHLMQFLGGESSVAAESSITKVRHGKFAIKADAFNGSGKCTVKVRVYKEEFARYAVEFQRRSGDCLAFNKIYQQGAQYLKLHFATGAAAPQCEAKELSALSDIRGMRPLLPPEDAFGADGMNQLPGLSPLLDMAGLYDQPTLQAEAASALADLAVQCGPPPPPSACIEELFAASSKLLLDTDRIDICYPAARTLSSLAEHPEAAPHFQGDHSLLQAIDGKMGPGAAAPLVQAQLANVRSKLGGAMAP